jgi:hypothetical protein
MEQRKKARIDGADGPPRLLTQLRSDNGCSDTAATTTLSFCSNFPVHSYQLFELPKELVEVVTKGGDLHIKGSKPGVCDAILCTSDQTFSIKKVETSNDVFIVPPSAQNNFSIEGKAIHQFYEVSQFAHSMYPVVTAVAVVSRSCVRWSRNAT